LGKVVDYFNSYKDQNKRVTEYDQQSPKQVLQQFDKTEFSVAQAVYSVFRYDCKTFLKEFTKIQNYG